MDKFLVTVTKTTEVEVEIDPTEMTEEWKAKFCKDFTNMETTEQHAKRIGLMIALQLQSKGEFIKGYGYVRMGTKCREPEYSYEALHLRDGSRMNINVKYLSEGIKIESEKSIS